MAPAGVPAILILTALLSAAAAPHESTAPPSLANATMPRLLGMWQYVAGAAQLPQHLLELLLIDHGHLNVEPGSGQELLVTQHVAVGDRCLSNNSTSIRLGANGTALLLHAKTQRILGTVTQLGSEDSLLIQHHVQRERTYSALYLYARSRTVSSAQWDELGRHAESLGLSRGAVVYAPWRKVHPHHCLASVDWGALRLGLLVARTPALSPPDIRRRPQTALMLPWDRACPPPQLLSLKQSFSLPFSTQRPLTNTSITPRTAQPHTSLLLHLPCRTQLPPVPPSSPSRSPAWSWGHREMCGWMMPNGSSGTAGGCGAHRAAPGAVHSSHPSDVGGTEGSAQCRALGEMKNAQRGTGGGISTGVGWQQRNTEGWVTSATGSSIYPFVGGCFEGAVPSGRKGKNGRKEGWRRARHSPAEHPNRRPAAINALLRAIAPPEQDLQKGTERLVCFVCHCPQRLGQAVLAASRAAGPAVGEGGHCWARGEQIPCRVVADQERATSGPSWGCARLRISPIPRDFASPKTLLLDALWHGAGVQPWQPQRQHGCSVVVEAGG